MLVIVFCFGFVDLKSNIQKEDNYDDAPICRFIDDEPPTYIGLNSSLIYSDLISNAVISSKNQFNYSYGLHLEEFIGKPATSNSSFKYGFNFTNLGYEFQQDNLKQNYNLSYLSINVNFRRLLFESQFYVIGGVNLNYLFDVESEIETLNNNKEKIKINRDFSGSEISNNYKRFDVIGSVGVGYDINMAGYFFSIEPKYNFSFFNHINENNQDLKGMNFKNEFWSLNLGVTFAL